METSICVSKLARLCGVSRQTVYKYLKKSALALHHKGAFA